MADLQSELTKWEHVQDELIDQLWMEFEIANETGPGERNSSDEQFCEEYFEKFCEENLSWYR